MQLIFLVHILSTFLSFTISLYLQLIHFPLLRYIGPYQYPVYFQKQKQRLTIVTFPVFTLEIFTSIFLMVAFFGGGKITEAKQNSFFIYLSSIILLLFIHLLTFYVIKPWLKKLLTAWDDKILNQLKLGNLVRTLMWLVRIIILFSIVINPG